MASDYSSSERVHFKAGPWANKHLRYVPLVFGGTVVVVGGSIVKLCEDTLFSLTLCCKDSEPWALSVSLLSYSSPGFWVQAM